MWESTEQAVKKVKESLSLANQYQSKLSPQVLGLEGMTGLKTRHFYNNLLGGDTNLNYLEIGTWRGSSFISSMYRNLNVKGYAVDDFNPNYGGTNMGVLNLELFKKNTQECLYAGEKFETIISEFYQFDPLSVPKIDTYLYDGDHIEHFQYNAFKRIFPCFADICVVIIDDYNALEVQSGTDKALKEFGKEIPFKVIHEEKIVYTTDGSHTPLEKAQIEFWNGIYVAVLEKA
jgi:hypothetical protein